MDLFLTGEHREEAFMLVKHTEAKIGHKTSQNKKIRKNNGRFVQWGPSHEMNSPGYERLD